MALLLLRLLLRKQLFKIHAHRQVEVQRQHTAREMTKLGEPALLAA